MGRRVVLVLIGLYKNEDVVGVFVNCLWDV